MQETVVTVLKYFPGKYLTIQYTALMRFFSNANKALNSAEEMKFLSLYYHTNHDYLVIVALL